jgi:ZIP family zinc transporter
MAFTMTLHNMPEGLAVAFSSYTNFGELMAVAIAMHNIPEGIIVAAPIFAATGSRTRALAIATLSGLSEPLGALAALAFVKPFLTPFRLQFALALTGVRLCSLAVKSCKTVHSALRTAPENILGHVSLVNTTLEL